MKLTKGMKKALSLLLSAAMVVTGVNVTTNTASAEGEAPDHVIEVVGAEDGTLGTVTLDGSADNIENKDDAVLKVYLNDWDKDEDGKARNSTCIHPTATVRADVAKYANPTVEVTSISEGKKVTIYSSMNKWNSAIQGKQLGKGDKVRLADVVACDEWAQGDNNVLQFSVPSGASATIKLYDGPAVKSLPLAEEDGYKTCLKFASKDWGASNMDLNEANGGKGVGTDTVITGNGDYTVSVDAAAMGKEDETIESASVLCVDFYHMATAQNLDISDMKIKNVVVKCDGRKVASDGSKMLAGAIEYSTKEGAENDNYRLEIYNAYGWNKYVDADGNKVITTNEFDNDQILFSKTLSVSFTIEGIKEGTTPLDSVVDSDENPIIKVAEGVTEADPVPSPSADVNPSPSAGATATPGNTTTPGKTTTTSGSGITTTTKPAVSATPQAVGTSKITPKKKLVVVAPGKSVKVAFTTKAAAPATKAAVVTASTSAKKVVTAKVSGKKVTIKAPKKAVKGSSATVTLKSTNGDKKVSAKIKVYVRNSAKKVKAAKKSITVKKNKTTKLVIKASKVQNKKKAFADTITVKGKILKLTNVKYAKGKATLTLKGAKKAKKKAVTIKVGKKSVKIKATVK